jgi:hypothetical protein
MSVFAVYLGEPICNSFINSSSINSVVETIYNVDTTGFITLSGSSTIQVLVYENPDGIVTFSGISEVANAQVENTYGAIDFEEFIIPIYIGNGYPATGSLIFNGSALISIITPVQHMHTDRTRIVFGYGTEVDILQLDSQEVPVYTENREVVIPYNPSFYEVY